MLLRSGILIPRKISPSPYSHFPVLKNLWRIFACEGFSRDLRFC
jgi:hypothetical protein